VHSEQDGGTLEARNSGNAGNADFSAKRSRPGPKFSTLNSHFSLLDAEERRRRVLEEIEDGGERRRELKRQYRQYAVRFLRILGRFWVTFGQILIILDALSVHFLSFLSALWRDRRHCHPAVAAAKVEPQLYCTPIGRAAEQPLRTRTARRFRSSLPVPFNLTEFFPTCPKEMLTLKLLTMYY